MAPLYNGLDRVVPRIERQFLRARIGGAAVLLNRGGYPVHAPLYAADALACVSDLGDRLDDIGGGLATWRRRNDRHRWRRATVEHRCQVGVRRGRRSGGNPAVEVVAHDVGRVQRLPELVNAGGRRAAHDRQEVAAPRRGGKPALVGQDGPAAVVRGDEYRGRPPGSPIPIANGTVESGRDDPTAVIGEDDDMHVGLVAAQDVAELASLGLPDPNYGGLGADISGRGPVLRRAGGDQLAERIGMRHGADDGDRGYEDAVVPRFRRDRQAT